MLVMVSEVIQKFFIIMMEIKYDFWLVAHVGNEL